MALKVIIVRLVLILLTDFSSAANSASAPGVSEHDSRRLHRLLRILRLALVWHRQAFLDGALFSSSFPQH